MTAAETVRPDSYLTLHYRITADDGTEFVSTFDLSPATLQMGSGQLADSLERCLLGLEAGDRRSFELGPEEAFGTHNPRLVERIALGALPAGIEVRENAVVEFTAPNGAEFAGFVRELTETHALFDFNHPLAGKPIRFDVEIVGVL